MGGSIAVTIRDAGGREHRMCRWTNSLPAFVNNLRFALRDEAHLRDYLGEWEEMRADYLRNKDNPDKRFVHPISGGPEQFEFPMTGAYAPHDTLAPHGYGLVVVDYVNNVVAHCQGYSKLCFMHDSGIFNDSQAVLLTAGGEVITDDDPDPRWRRAYDWQDMDAGRLPPEKSALVASRGFVLAESAVALKELWEAGRVRHVLVNHRPAEDERTLLGMDFQSYLAGLYAAWWGGEAGRRRHVEFELDVSPFEVVRLEQDEEGFGRLRELVTGRLGFRLSAEEERLWDEYVSERYDD